MQVGIVGASGYTGLELVRILACHSKVTVSSLTSERFAGLAIDEVFPSLRGFVDVRLSDLSVEKVAQEADFIFTALPHGTSMGVVEEFVQRGKSVVDLSADFRLKDRALYER